MAFGYKILGQTAPSTTSAADLYTVPTGKEAIISTIAIANVTADAVTYRVFVRSASGVASGISNALAYDVEIAANSSVLISGPVTVAAGNIISVRSSVADALTFHAYGTEVTV